MSEACDPEQIAMKSFFLGPQAENGPWLQAMTSEVLQSFFGWRRHLHPEDGRAIGVDDIGTPEFQARRARTEAAVRELLARFEGELPKFSPRYVGHMFSEISMPALLGQLAAILHNPNNISGESSRVGVEIEEEAITSLLTAIGMSRGSGHFTSGGTLANIEALLRARARSALWLAAGARARALGLVAPDLFSAAHLGWERMDGFELSPSALSAWNFVEAGAWQAGASLSEAFGVAFRGPVVLAPRHRHYSWPKAVSSLGLGDEALWPVALDGSGRLDVADLERSLRRAQRERRPVLMVVSVAGTTELGAIDPVDQVQDLLDAWRTEQGIHIWHHVDAAYGGLLCTVGTEPPLAFSTTSARALRAISRANSVTLDPHKLGYVPYACGALLVRERADYRARTFGGPYVQFGSRDKGPYTLEGSRSAAGAAATWLTAKSIGLDASGLGRILGRTLRIKRSLEARFAALGEPVRVLPHTDANILAFFAAGTGSGMAAANTATEQIFAALSPGSGGPFIVSKTRLGWRSYRAYLEEVLRGFDGIRDTDELVAIRLCLMNPFFASKQMNVPFEDALVEAIRALTGTGAAARAI